MPERAAAVSIDPIKAAIAAAILIALGLFGWRIHEYGQSRYEAGKSATQADWDAAVERGRIELERLRTEASKVTVRTETKYIDRVKVIREKGDAIVREVQVFVPADTADLPGGWRLLHDAAAANDPVPEASGIAHAAGVPAQTAAITVAENYAAAHENAARLTSLQEWVRSQCKANPPPEGCPQ